MSAQFGQATINVATPRALGINPRSLGISPRDLTGKSNAEIARAFRAAATILLEQADKIEFGEGDQ